jgi:hypothetical protein
MTVNVRREKRGLAEQAAADHARDALINETAVSETQTTRTCRAVQFLRRWFLYTRPDGAG